MVKWVGQTLLIARKDLQIEKRTREITMTSAFFAALLAITTSVALQSGPDIQTRVAPAVIWIATAFAAILAVSKTWQREREESALDGLLVSPVYRSSIFAGKALSVLTFLIVVQMVTVPLVAVLFSIDIWNLGWGVLLIAAFALPGICATTTLFGAMTVRTNSRDLVLASVLFPLLLPALLAAVAACRELFAGAPVGELRDYLVILTIFDIVFTTGGLALFGSLIDG
jgi:heme exporter protein B